MVSGLTGSVTPDTPVLPLKFESYDGPWDFVAPIPDLSAVFNTSCKSTDDAKSYMRLTSTLQGNLKGSVIVFTSFTDAACTSGSIDAKIYAKVEEHHAGGCLEISAPENKDCFNKLGAVKSVTVVQGGSGYKTDAFEAISGTGQNLAGRCVADESGRITSIDITQAGYGYGKDTIIKCKSACTADCSSSSKPGQGAVFTVNVENITFAVAAGQWHSGTGTMKMRVRTSLPQGNEKQVSFLLTNGHTAQSGVKAVILAGGTTRGSTPIESSLLDGRDVMHISKRTTAVTHVCESTDTTPLSCLVSEAFKNVPQNLRSYSLKAERQCNTNATSVTVKLGDVQVPSTKMAKMTYPACVDSCAQYQLLFEYLDVKSIATYNGGSGGLKLEVTAENTRTTGNHCGTNSLRIIFTMEYDEQDTLPASEG